jgi:hypothetical protein
MRKFHLLNAEWRFRQRLADIRAYYIFCSGRSGELPEPGTLFPFLAEPEEQDFGDADDDVIYQRVAATLGAR